MPITERWTTLDPHPVQTALYRTKKRFCAVYAGRGSGKTELARRRCVRMLCVEKPWPDPKYFFGLPTRDQAHRIAWPALKALVPPEWLAGPPSESNMTIKTVFGSQLIVFGMDKPHRIEGDQYDGGVLDESSDQRPGSFDKSVRPALSWREGWCWRIGVPKRAGCGAQEFKKTCEKWKDGEDTETFTWPSWDVMDPEEIRAAREQLDPKDFNEQYGASWETVGGQVFYAFDGVLNVQDVQYNAALPLLIGCDFNVDPMAWVVAQAVGDELHVFDELWMRNTNTMAALKKLSERYGKHPLTVNFYGDATGRARKTAASESDYVQIRNTQHFKETRVFFPMSNPHVCDRFAATNALLCSASGRRRLKVNSRCQNLIRDLEMRAYKPGTTEPDDHDDVGHVTDGLGYLVFQKYPLRVALTTASPTVSMG
jgi:hypothetical protein